MHDRLIFGQLISFTAHLWRFLTTNMWFPATLPITWSYRCIAPCLCYRKSLPYKEDQREMANLNRCSDPDVGWRWVGQVRRKWVGQVRQASQSSQSTVHIKIQAFKKVIRDQYFRDSPSIRSCLRYNKNRYLTRNKSFTLLYTFCHLRI